VGRLAFASFNDKKFLNQLHGWLWSPEGFPYFQNENAGFLPVNNSEKIKKDFDLVSNYKVLNYEMVNKWLIKSFGELGLNLQYGNLRKSSIKTNCFGTSLISDLVEQDGFKRIGSAQFRKKGAFLQHGEIQTNPSRDLWFKLFKEEAPPKVNLKLTNDEIVQHLRNSFVKNKSNINFKNITIDNKNRKF